MTKPITVNQQMTCDIHCGQTDLRLISLKISIKSRATLVSLLILYLTYRQRQIEQ